MPTGYTAKIMEQDVDFSEFILNCARAFGACVSLRDEDGYLPAPRSINDASTYHQDQLVVCQEDLAKFKEITDEELLEWVKEEKKREIELREEYLAHDINQNMRLEKMKVSVVYWEPPTPEHQGLKDFMLNQIKISTNDLSWHEEALAKALEVRMVNMVIDKFKELERLIAYHEKHIEEDYERMADKNKWLDDLYSSLGIEE